jgi:hypothetical protein
MGRSTGKYRDIGHKVPRERREEVGAREAGKAALASDG